jgi:hypothetical protein
MRSRLFIAIAAALVVFACGDSATGPSGSSSLTVMLKDSPFGDAKSVLVTFSEVSAHKADTADSAWSTLAFAGGATSRTCDLKKLETAQDILGTAALTPGHYTMIRLVVSSATLYFDNAADGPACAPTVTAPAGRSAPVEVPSGVVRLNRQFELQATDATTILVDFDGDASIHETGNGRYVMQPVITIVSVQ